MIRPLVVVAALMLAGCAHPPPAYESHYTSPPDPPKESPVAIIGDSYTTGSDMGGHDEHGWPRIVANELRDAGLPIYATVAAEGASGYAKPGHNGTAFGDEVPKAVKLFDRLVVLFGSRNDSTEIEALPSAVQTVLAQVKDGAPDAKILVIGPPWPTADLGPGISETRDILKVQAEAVGAVFVDPIAEQWFWDRPDLIGPDGVHPTDAGHQYMADKIAPLMSQQLQAPPP